MVLKTDSIAECEAFREAEDKILESYKAHAKFFAPMAACVALDGWQVVRHVYTDADRAHCGIGGWYDPELGAGLCFAGYTHAKERTIEITGTFTGGALPHEMGHVMLGIGHCGWKERGIKDAIKGVTGSDDPTKNSCD
jgi:hypothetical protein